MTTKPLVVRSLLLSSALLGAAFPACSSSPAEPRSGETSSADSTMTELLVLRGGALLGIAGQDGAASAVGADDWTGSQALTSINGTAYAVQGSNLFRIDPIGGTRTVLGTGNWTGTSLLAPFDGWLYAVQGAGMYRVNPTDGSYSRLGTGDWTGTSALIGDVVNGISLYAVQGPGLYRVDPFGGQWARVGTGDWTGTNVLTGYAGWLYAIQGAGLWQVNTSDGTWTRLGTGDWTGTAALTTDTRRFFAIQGGKLFDIDPPTGAFAALDSVDWTGSVAMTAASATKPQKTLTLTPDGLTLDLVGALTGIRLQLDQTGDPSHAGPLTARAPACVPASAGAIAACRAGCLDSSGDDPNLLKACLTNCSALNVCTSVCSTHSTADYLTLGQALKALAQKACTSPDVSCPPCTVGDGGLTTSAVEDFDLTEWIPVPLFQTVVASDPFSCTLGTFGFDTTDPHTPNFAYTFDGGGFHLDLTGYASSPTLDCNNGINPTVINPHFLFDLTPIVVLHHPTLPIVTNFSGHLDYAFDWIASLDNTLASHVRGAIAGVIGRYQSSIDQQFEKWLTAKIKGFNKDDVDDFISVRADAGGITVVYTPLCVGGICSCTPDCANKTCGKDAHCGAAVCGGCSPGQFCNDGAGACQCAPQCAGKTCGSDGCGGTCGTCATHEACSGGGQCVCVPRTACGGACGVQSDGCGGTFNCRPCVCTPSCAGKRCGAGDGCGGQCSGYCTKAGYACTDDGNGPYCARAP